MRVAIAVLPAMAALALLPGVARADVLEINGQDHGWVAGGPKSATPDLASPAQGIAMTSTIAGPAGEQGLSAPDHAPNPAALTEVSDDAGPAHWRARVAQLAAKYDISPALLEAVVWQESRWNPSAVSPVGARGLTQLMPGTARMMGVDADDPHMNLEGGARYLREQLDAFGGDVQKALAAYNAGPARVRRAGGIPAIRETQEYVAAIMARLSAPVRK